METSPPVISIVGYSKVGKTVLLEKVVRELKKRGYRVATVKHTAHGFEIDTPGKDSWRYAQAGSDIVMLTSSERLVFIERLDRDLSLNEVVARIPQGRVDIVLTEGYKQEDGPKIGVIRDVFSGEELLSRVGGLIAIVSERSLGDKYKVPQYGSEDISSLVDLIEARFLGGDVV